MALTRFHYLSALKEQNLFTEYMPKWNIESQGTKHSFYI